MLNCFKEMHYKVDLKPFEIMERIKSKTVSSNHLHTDDIEIKGTFYFDTFKLQFLPPKSIFIKDSYRPIFYGKVAWVDNHSKLSIKMRPNIAGYIFLLYPIVNWLFYLIYKFVLDIEIQGIIISLTFITLGFWIYFFGIAIYKYYKMKPIIENLFLRDFIW